MKESKNGVKNLDLEGLALFSFVFSFDEVQIVCNIVARVKQKMIVEFLLLKKDFFRSRYFGETSCRQGVAKNN